MTATSMAVGGAFAWWRWPSPGTAILAIATTALFLLALVAPRAYAPIHYGFERVVHGLLQAFTWLLLGMVFVLIFIPGRIVLALRGRDPLARRAAPAGSGYWRKPPPRAGNADAHFRAQF